VPTKLGKESVFTPAQYSQRTRNRSQVFLCPAVPKPKVVLALYDFAVHPQQRATEKINHRAIAQLLASSTNVFASDLVNSTRMSVSIIIPVLNEASLLGQCLARLRERAPGAEIIVADGGSSDGTADLARGLCDQLVVSKRNRAIQMNAGEGAAHGDILWFVHVDAEVPWGCLDEIERILADPKVAGGFFRIRLPTGWVYRLTDSFAHHAGVLLRMRCGDHGLFCRRAAFLDIGGFPEVPLMEDVEFFRRLQRRGRVICSQKRILASSRRYETVGRMRLTLAYGLIAMLYIFGVPLSKLASLYGRICCKTV
jgi:rSAM/selenodomain-associated transferase 2